MGDDYVRKKVKLAIKNLIKNKLVPKKHVLRYDESYVILPANVTKSGSKELMSNIMSSAEEVRHEIADSESIRAVRGFVEAGDIQKVLEEFPGGESVTTELSHTQGQMVLHEALRYTVNQSKKDPPISPTVLRLILDDSANWKKGSVNSSALSPWAYVSHKMGFLNGTDS